MTVSADALTDGTVTLRPSGPRADERMLRFLVECEGDVVGEVALRLLDDLVGQLTWSTDPAHRERGIATRAVRLATRHALHVHGLARVQAYVDPADVASLRIAGRSGLRREGVLRGLAVRGEGGRRGDLVVFARLADDPEPHEPEGFRALLNAFLPRKRVISQLAIRDRQQRLLVCQLSYKPDWDLPGGVVEVGESPRVAASREVREELALTVPAGALLLVDWLPPWSGWEDACTLVFDGGEHGLDLVDAIVPEPREIVRAEFCDLQAIRERCAPQTLRRASAALDAVAHGTRYLESGEPPQAAQEP